MNEENQSFWQSLEFRKLLKLASLFVLILSIFVAVLTVNAVRSFSHIGQESAPYATVSFSGEGEVFAVPDTAEFSFSVTHEAETAEAAQGQVTERMNSIIETLKELGIEERDIKTTGYNLRPRYEFRTQGTTIPRSPNQRVLVGYEVRHTLSVKVKDIDQAGDVLSRVGQMNVSNISSLRFTVEDEEALKREARELAIEEAKEKAENTARDLGVRLVGIVGFQEERDGFVYPRFEMAEDVAFSAPSATPEIPTGENRVSSRVSITYEIR